MRNGKKKHSIITEVNVAIILTMRPWSLLARRTTQCERYVAG